MLDVAKNTPTLKIVQPSIVSSGRAEVDVKIIDDVLADERRRGLNSYLHQSGWRFGWRSDPQDEGFPLWHKHFAGPKLRDRYETDSPDKQCDCERELAKTSQLLYGFWLVLKQSVLQRHVLVRCYANATPFGCEGTVHTDSASPSSYTSVYYPHGEWQINWAGETVLYDPDQADIIASVYPKPNRLLMFKGNIPHVARGVSRSCPVLRITLMFKTERCL